MKTIKMWISVAVLYLSGAFFGSEITFIIAGIPPERIEISIATALCACLAGVIGSGVIVSLVDR